MPPHTHARQEKLVRMLAAVQSMFLLTLRLSQVSLRHCVSLQLGPASVSESLLLLRCVVAAYVPS